MTTKPQHEQEAAGEAPRERTLRFAPPAPVVPAPVLPSTIPTALVRPAEICVDEDDGTSVYADADIIPPERALVLAPSTAAAVKGAQAVIHTQIVRRRSPPPHHTTTVLVPRRRRLPQHDVGDDSSSSAIRLDLRGREKRPTSAQEAHAEQAQAEREPLSAPPPRHQRAKANAQVSAQANAQASAHVSAHANAQASAQANAFEHGPQNRSGPSISQRAAAAARWYTPRVGLLLATFVGIGLVVAAAVILAIDWTPASQQATGHRRATARWGSAVDGELPIEPVVRKQPLDRARAATAAARESLERARASAAQRDAAAVARESVERARASAAQTNANTAGGHGDLAAAAERANRATARESAERAERATAREIADGTAAKEGAAKTDRVKKAPVASAAAPLTTTSATTGAAGAAGAGAAEIGATATKTTAAQAPAANDDGFMRVFTGAGFGGKK